MFCMKCGTQLPDEAAFCSSCGNPVGGGAAPINNTNAGGILLADNAFVDGRYEEAYQLYAQVYATNQNDSHVSVRLGLSTAAREYFANGVPDSAKDLIAKGFDIAKKEAESYEALVNKINSFVMDVKKVVKDINDVLITGIVSAYDKAAPTRSTGAVVADVLFSPMDSANRNLYEDRRIEENNKKLVDNAVTNNRLVKREVHKFVSLILRLVANVIVQPLPDDSPLFVALGEFVRNSVDARIYQSLCVSHQLPPHINGLCYGVERTLLEFKGTTCFLYVNGKTTPTLTPPKGDVIITNYRVIFRAKKEKLSFERPLNEILSVSEKGWLTLNFKNAVYIDISVPVGSKYKSYAANLLEDLKMDR